MSYEEKRAGFAKPAPEYRPIAYLELPAPDSEHIKADILREMAKYSALGCQAVIPQLPEGTVLNEAGLAPVREMYEILLAVAEETGMKVGFHLDPAFEHAVVQTLTDLGETALCAKMLDCREYLCTAGEKIDRPLHAGELLSLVAFSEENDRILDLRGYIREGRLVFEVPDGNWVIREYLALPDTESGAANYLSYEASYRYISAAFSLFERIFTPYLENGTLSLLSYSEIGFNGKNRRNWDASFNTLFRTRFGFDPAPYYPALFTYIGKDTRHIKAMMMTVRASMIQHGIMQALYDFATKMGLSPFGSLSEPKLTACSFPVGDAMLNNIYSPCALYDKAYLYGTNSVKIAAGAAYNFDNRQVNAELFRHYSRHDRERLCRDAMNAFARGVNHAALHFPAEIENDRPFCDFISRVQLMLRGGRHVADIAMLYPIYFLHSEVNLYFSSVEGYEYPATPGTADYMTLINSVSFYAGHDLTVLHPKALSTRCHTANGLLYLDNDKNHECFRVLILPCSPIISLTNLHLIKRFYDEGGKLLATGGLPYMAFEWDESGENDREVQETVREIFGADACNPHIMRDFCYQKNAAGGEAIFLYFNDSAMDGTQMVRSSTVNEALNTFGIPFDLYLPAMPRLETTGSLNSVYPEFHTIGLHRGVPGNGMLTHIHKRVDGDDIYYFSNTTNKEYNHHVLLRGAHTVEEWNPFTGGIVARNAKFFTYKNTLYTDLRLTLLPNTSVFFYAKDAAPGTGKPEEIRSIDALRSEHAMLMSEF